MAIISTIGLYVAVATGTTGGTAPGGASAPTGASLSGTVTDLSAWVSSAEAGEDFEENDVTTMGSGGFKAFVLGLEQGMVSINFFNDYAAGGPNAILGMSGTLKPSRTLRYLEIRQSSASRSATNPGFLAAFYNKGWRSANAQVGQAPTVAWTPTITGGFAELTA